MQWRPGGLRYDKRVRVVVDVLLTGGVLVPSLTEVAADRPEWTGAGRAVGVMLALGASVPLPWRRRYALAVATVCGAATIVGGIVASPTQGPFESFVAFMVATYAVGRYVPGRPGEAFVVAAVAVIAAVTAMLLATVRDAQVGDWLPVAVWTVGFWTVGRIVSGYDRRTRQLEVLTSELAAARDARAHDAVTVERARIARELHDVVGHNVSLISVQAAAARRVLDVDPHFAGDALRVIEETARSTVDEMRRMLEVLRDDGDELLLAPQAGLDALSPLTDQLQAGGFRVELRVEGEPVPLAAGLELTVYRIVKEALTNVLKHAKATQATVAISHLPQLIRVEVSDDGSANDHKTTHGQGLIGMRERVALFGGHLRAGPRPGGGWSVFAELPVVSR